jgi:hypothetical protein
VSDPINSFYEADLWHLYSGVAAVGTGARCMGVHRVRDFSVGSVLRCRMELLFVPHVTLTEARGTGIQSPM